MGELGSRPLEFGSHCTSRNQWYDPHNHVGTYTSKLQRPQSIRILAQVGIGQPWTQFSAGLSHYIASSLILRKVAQEDVQKEVAKLMIQSLESTAKGGSQGNLPFKLT